MLPDITNHCNIENHNLAIFESACSNTKVRDLSLDDAQLAMQGDRAITTGPLLCFQGLRQPNWTPTNFYQGHTFRRPPNHPSPTPFPRSWVSRGLLIFNLTFSSPHASQC